MPPAAAAQPGPGHNGVPGMPPGMTESEFRALFTSHFGKIAAQRAIVKAAKEIERTLRKSAKVDGIVLRDIDHGLRCVELENADTIIPAELHRHALVAAWMSLPVGTQMGLDFEGKKEKPLERARRLGYDAGFSKREPKSPFSPGTEEDQTWLAAHAAGLKQNHEDLASALQKASDARMEAARRKKADRETKH